MTFIKTALVISLFVAAGCGDDTSGGGPADLAVAPADLAAGAPSKLTLPGSSYYPESLHAAADGSLFVDSLATGTIVRFAPGATRPTTFVAGGDGDGGTPKGIAGVFADGATSTLWACAVDFAEMPYYTEVRAFDLASGAAKATYQFPAPAFCNDFAVDGAGNLYVSDSYGSVYELAHGTTTLTQWSADPLLRASVATGFGADGIVFDASGPALLDSVFNDGRLVRIPVNSDGSAGGAAAIAVTPPLHTPDGMRLVDATTLIAADGAAGQLVELTLAGTSASASVLAGGLDGPTSVVQIGDRYYVSEGQIGHFTGQLSGPPSLPFDVRVLPLP
jgi:sugar lactone lactonase YvrE